MQGVVAFEDFKRVFQSSEDEMESHGDANFEPVPPKNMPELVDLQKGATEELVSVTDVFFQDFKIKVKPIVSFSAVWNSQDTQSASQCALWVPTAQSSMMTGNKVC